MAKMHVSLNVANVARTVEFYRKFFGTEPVKLKHDYAKFELADPPLNFTMNERQPDDSGEHGKLSHLGFQVEGHGDVEAARKRFRAAGLISLDEKDTVCCYARQDKVWVTDPDGNRWEVFFVTDADVDAATFQGDACCVPLEAAEGDACCTPDAKELAVASKKGCC